AFLFYVATASAVVTFVIWMLLGDTRTAVESTVTVLVIACPHALGLAIPLVIAISTAVSARAGILVKDRLALERMRSIDAVLFDKTGTLTRGEHAVTGVAASGGIDDELLMLAGAAEADSEHPLAKAIVAAARTHGSLPSAREFRSLTGRGVEAVVDGHRVAVGGPILLRERNLVEPAEVSARIAEWHAHGASVLYVVRDDHVAGAIALEDDIRPESYAAVAQLHRYGLRVVMITGDAKQVAEHVASQLGIDELFAEVLPQDKEHAVAELQSRK